MSFVQKYPGYKSFRLIQGPVENIVGDGWDLLDVIPDAIEHISTVAREKVFFIPSNDNRDYNDREKKIQYFAPIKIKAPMIILGKKEESRIEELTKQLNERESKIRELDNQIDNVRYALKQEKEEMKKKEDMFEGLNDRIKSLHDRLEEMEKDKIAYKDRADALARSNASYPQVITDLNRQIEQLKDLLAKGSESPVSDVRNIDLD